MAAGELTGADQSELREMEQEHRESPLYQDHGVPFDVAYCLKKIGKQPDDYDGPTRYCKKRVGKTIDKGDGKYDEASYNTFCRFHGGNMEKVGHEQKHRLANPLTVTIKHGAYAEDKHLIMDFNDEEQELFDSIMEDWPEIYDWPDESEDPARYRILRRVAVNEVRSVREENYLDEDGEVHHEPVYDDQGVQVGEKEVENPLAREYRLLMAEITNQMKELGLTPKERQKMDTLSSQADKDEALSDIANEALHAEDAEYDPDQFDES